MHTYKHMHMHDAIRKNGREGLVFPVVGRVGHLSRQSRNTSGTHTSTHTAAILTHTNTHINIHAAHMHTYKHTYKHIYTHICTHTSTCILLYAKMVGKGWFFLS